MRNEFFGSTGTVVQAIIIRFKLALLGYLSSSVPPECDQFNTINGLANIIGLTPC